MRILLSCLLSYLLGSLPISYWIGKLYKKNLLEIGSKNVGTANVWRATKSPLATLLALIGDGGKGILALFLTKKFFCSCPSSLFLSVFFVILGHNFSIFLKFKGGRGLASLAGILLYLNFEAFLLVIFTLLFSILIFETIKNPRLNLGTNFKEITSKVIFILISQIGGRMLGILLSVFLVFKLYPETFEIMVGGIILSLLRHLERLKRFLNGERV